MWVLCIIISYLLVYSHNVLLEVAWVKTLYIQKTIFISPGKCILNGEQPHFVCSCWNVLSQLMIKISHIYIGISIGLFLGTSHYFCSANTICIVHPSTQHIHTKTGPIAVPWCRVLTTPGTFHYFTGMALCFHSNKGWQSAIRLHGITQVQQVEYLDKIGPTAMEWNEVLQQYVTEKYLTLKILL